MGLLLGKDRPRLFGYYIIFVKKTIKKTKHLRARRIVNVRIIGMYIYYWVNEIIMDPYFPDTLEQIIRFANVVKTLLNN